MHAIIKNDSPSIAISDFGLNGGAMMPSLSVRKIEVETLSLLRQQAARHGVSMEEEVRTIIKQSVSTPERLGKC